MTNKPEAPPKPKVQPRPTSQSQPFWDGAGRGEFLLQVSGRSGRAQFFPRPQGLATGEASGWNPASGRGILRAVTVCRVPAPGYEGEAPYAMGIVQLAEGPRVLAQIVGTAPEALVVGQAVQLRWDTARPGLPMFLFEPA